MSSDLVLMSRSNGISDLSLYREKLESMEELKGKILDIKEELRKIPNDASHHIERHNLKALKKEHRHELKKIEGQLKKIL